MANTVSNFLDSHHINKKILLIAILVGLIHVSFVPIAQYSLPTDDFLLLSYNTSTVVVIDMTIYASWVGDILDGHLFYNEYFTNEHSYILWPNQQKGTIYFMALIALLLGGSVTFAVIFMYFLIPAIVFLAVYIFLQRSTNHKASILAIGIPLIIFLLTNNYEWKLLFQDWHILDNIKEAFVQYFWISEKPLNFVRITTPNPNFLWFFLYLFLLISVLKKPNTKKSILLGLFLGAAFFTYIYLASLLVLLTIVSFGIQILMENKKLLKYYLVTFSVAAVLGIPYLYILVSYSQTDYGVEYVNNVDNIGRFDIRILPTLLLAFTSAMMFRILKKCPHTTSL